MNYLKISAFSCAGSRGSNEDNLLIDKLKKPALLGSTYIFDPVKVTLKENSCCTFAVTDGIGGMADGETAALEIIKYLYKNRTKPANDDYWLSLNKRCIKKAPYGGSTLVCCRLSISGGVLKSEFYSLGDSLIYMFKSGEKIEKVSRIDNCTGNSEKDAIQDSSAITEYFGKRYEDKIPVFKSETTINDGDKIIISSDGIRYLDTSDLAAALQRRQFGENIAFSVANAALDKAKRNTDNITVIVMEYWDN